MAADTPHKESPGRRQFLTTLLKATMAMAAVVFAYPFLRFSRFTVKPQPRYKVIKKNIPLGGSYTDHDFILFRFQEGPFAVSRRCTHLGCRVLYRKELDFIECPCHQSRFSTRGERIAGPAQKNLAVFPVRILTDDNGKVDGYEVTI